MQHIRQRRRGRAKQSSETKIYWHKMTMTRTTRTSTPFWDDEDNDDDDDENVTANQQRCWDTYTYTNILFTCNMREKGAERKELPRQKNCAKTCNEFSDISLKEPTHHRNESYISLPRMILVFVDGCCGPLVRQTCKTLKTCPGIKSKGNCNNLSCFFSSFELRCTNIKASFYTTKSDKSENVCVC